MDYCHREPRYLTRCVEGCTRAVDGNCARRIPYTDDGYGTNPSPDNFAIPTPPTNPPRKHKHNEHHKHRNRVRKIRDCFVKRVRGLVGHFMR